MAKEYIERKRAIVDACNSLELYPSEYAELENALNRIPAADVAPVVHGWWVFGKDLPDSSGSINKNKCHLYCSECRNQAVNKTVDNDPDFDVDTPFCPWCGAKMDEEWV